MMKAMRLLKTEIIIIVIVGMLTFIHCRAYAFQNEPDGFRGIEWGADLSSVKGMKYLAALPANGGIKIYIREGDAMEIGGANLESIEYASWQGKFFGVFIKTFFYSDWEALKRACFEKFGKGTKPKIYVDEYIWNGEKTTINLVVSEGGVGGTLYMLSTVITKQQEAQKKQRQKQGHSDAPVKGF